MRGRDRATGLRLAYVTLAAVDTWLAGSASTRARRARWVTKPLLMPTLAATTLSRSDRRPGADLVPVLLGQLGGWGGDVALLRPGTRPFLVGVGSFAVGHLAYLTGLHRARTTAPWTSSSGARAAAACWVLGGPVLATRAARRDRALGLPVLGYSALLASVVAAASRLHPSLPRPARRLSAGGAWLFLVSDTTLAVRAFVLTDAPPAVGRAVMATYAAAQLALAEGAVRSLDRS